jgi:signal peptidase I
MAEATRAEKAKGSPATRVSTQTSARRVVVEYIKAIGLAVLLALVIRQFIVQAFRIPTGSMEKTLLVGDFLFVDKFVYGAKTPDRIHIPLLNVTLVDHLPVLKLPALRQPRQGDVIVFQFPQDPTQDYIKRCVAVPGDTVQVREGLLYVNGQLYEPHSWHDRDKLVHGAPQNMNYGPTVVPPGHIFMMGDNRYNSFDSRFWGPLDERLIRGRALFIYWSWDADRMRPRLGRIGRIIH